MISLILIPSYRKWSASIAYFCSCSSFNRPLATLAVVEDSAAFICTSKLNGGELNFFTATFRAGYVDRLFSLNLVSFHDLNGGQLLAQR